MSADEELLMDSAFEVEVRELLASGNKISAIRR